MKIEHFFECFYSIDKYLPLKLSTEHGLLILLFYFPSQITELLKFLLLVSLFTIQLDFMQFTSSVISFQSNGINFPSLL